MAPPLQFKKIHSKVKVIQIYGVESNERKHLETIIHIVYGKYNIEMQLLYYIIILRGTIVLIFLQKIENKISLSSQFTTTSKM